METSRQNEGFLEQAAGVIASATNRAMADGTVAAMGREAVKDVRSTMFDVFFGRPEHGGEPGAPLNPTQGEVAAARQDDGIGQEEANLPAPSEVAAMTSLYEPQQDRSNGREQGHGLDHGNSR